MVQQARGSRFVKQVEREQNIALLAERKTLTQQITAAKEKLGGVLPGLLKAQAKLRQEREDMIARHHEELLQINKRLNASQRQQQKACIEHDGIVGPAERVAKNRRS